MKPIALVLLVLPLIVVAPPAHAQDSFQNVAFFYPLRTRRPVIERELEFHVEHAKGAAGRTTEAAAAIELPIMPRWQVEVEVPFVLNAHVAGPNEQELTASAAAGWRVTRVFAPLVELVTVTRTRASPDDDLRGKTRVSIIPGFNAKLLPGSTLRFGVEFPLTRARTADYTLLGGFVKEF